MVDGRWGGRSAFVYLSPEDGAGDSAWPGAVCRNMQLIKSWKFTVIQDEKQMKSVPGGRLVRYKWM